MSTSKVGRSGAQIKLMFDGTEEQECPVERLMEELGLELRPFAASAGMLLMHSIMKMEEAHLAGPRLSRKTEVNRWCKEQGSVVVGGQRLPVVLEPANEFRSNVLRLRRAATVAEHDHLAPVLQRATDGPG